MAIGDVASPSDVPLPEILAAFDLPADTPPATALKDLESDVFSVTASARLAGGPWRVDPVTERIPRSGLDGGPETTRAGRSSMLVSSPALHGEVA